MKIKINLDKQEVKDIIKKHVFKEFPIDTKDQEVYVSEAYGDFVVEINPKLEPAEEEDIGKDTNQKDQEE